MNPKKLVRKGTIALVKEGEIEKIETIEELNKLYQLKVREELEEIVQSKHNDIMEFADLISVVTAYARINGYDSRMLQKAVEIKITEKGGFSDLALNNLNPENPSNRIYFEKDNLSFNGTLLFNLESKQDWINKCPGFIPEKKSRAELWLWLDNKGNTLTMGEDFEAAEELNTFPVRVYKLIRTSETLLF